ncbi:MAG: hypothetical protein WCS08_02550 [Eubacteriales bacterium]
MKAPKFPNYKDISKKKKVEEVERLSKAEWQTIETERIEKRKESHRRSDEKRREKQATITFRVDKKDRDKIFSKIELSGQNRQTYMTKAILDAPIKVVATQNIIDSCRNKLDRIYEELLRLESYKDLDSVSETELKMIMEIINAAIKKEKSL